MKLDRLIFILTVAVAVGAAGKAAAQADVESPAADSPTARAPVPQPSPAEPLPAEVAPYPDHRADILGPPQAPPRWMPVSVVGMALLAGGGVTDFIEGGARNETRTGGSWTARLTVGTRSIFAFDGSYVGGANAINGLGTGNATLIRNGLEAAARINAPLVARDTLLEPYVLVGVGWNSYRITNMSSVNASLSPTSDNTLSVPLAAGFTVGYHGLLADLRCTVRPTYDQNVLTDQTGSALSNWDLGAMLGYEF